MAMESIGIRRKRRAANTDTQQENLTISLEAARTESDNRERTIRQRKIQMRRPFAVSLLGWLLVFVAQRRPGFRVQSLQCCEKPSAHFMPYTLKSSARSHRATALYSQSPETEPSEEKTVPDDVLGLLQPSRPMIKKHQGKKPYKPHGYWKDISNFDKELADLWRQAIGCQDKRDPRLEAFLRPPPIPSNALFSHWNRHDINGAIRAYGGKEKLAKALSDHHYNSKKTKNAQCYIVPGKWQLATGYGSNSSPHPLIERILEIDESLNPKHPPVSGRYLKILKSKRYDMSEEDIQAWKTGETRGRYQRHDQTTRRTTRKQGGQLKWTKDDVCAEVSEYLSWRKDQKGIPSIWMPQLIEFYSPERGNDERFWHLKHAIPLAYGTATRKAREDEGAIGGVERLCFEMGLVQYNDWKPIESFHDLMISLKEHIDAEHEQQRKENPELPNSPDYRLFPKDVYKWKTGTDSERRLFYLLKKHGGKRAVCERLQFFTSKNAMIKRERRANAARQRNQTLPPEELFDLNLGISLMEYVRLEQREKEPLRIRRIGNMGNCRLVNIPDRNSLLSKSPSSAASLAASKIQSAVASIDGETWGEYLDRKITECGGYGSVARRLGLNSMQSNPTETVIISK